MWRQGNHSLTSHFRTTPTRWKHNYIGSAGTGQRWKLILPTLVIGVLSGPMFSWWFHCLALIWFAVTSYVPRGHGLNGIESMGLWGIFWLVWFLQVSTVYIFKKIKITITSTLLQRSWCFCQRLIILKWKIIWNGTIAGTPLHWAYASNSRARRHRNCVRWLEKSFWPQFEVADTLDFIVG